MNQERIERLEGIAKEAGIDIKILPHKNVSETGVRLVAEKVKLDEKIRIFENLVSKGRITDKDDIRAEIDRFLELLGYTLEIDHLPAADKALEARNLLTEKQRIKLSSSIKLIYNFRARVRKRAEEFHAPEICGECGGGCCGRDIEKSFSEMDFFYMFYVLRGEQVNKIWKIFKRPDMVHSRCRFQGADSCIIPAEGRPNFCQTYYCENIPIIGQTETDLYADELTDKLKELQKKLKKMGFDLKTCD